VNEKRQHPRQVIECEVSFQVGDGPASVARCRDISLGGMFIETPSPLPYGTALRLLLPLPGLPAGARIDAVVRWGKPTGMGVQFGVMGARDTHALTELLAQG
jgi:Tfp pilus assembly protein PilZ